MTKVKLQPYNYNQRPSQEALSFKEHNKGFQYRRTKQLMSGYRRRHSSPAYKASEDPDYEGPVTRLQARERREKANQSVQQDAQED